MSLRTTKILIPALTKLNTGGTVDEPAQAAGRPPYKYRPSRFPQENAGLRVRFEGGEVVAIAADM